MVNQKKKLYLYLARRDKKGLKVISIFPHPEGTDFLPTRVQDIKNLNLPSTIEPNIAKAVNDNRMMWEPWIQSASSYADLRTSLKARGYRNLPTHSMPMHPNMPSRTVVPKGEADDPVNLHVVNKKSYKTMVRKRKD